MPEKCEHCGRRIEPEKNEYWHYFKVTLPTNIVWLILYIIAFLFIAPHLSTWLHALSLV